MSADYPLTIPVTRVRRTIGPPDDLNNDTEVEETETVLVFGWSVPSSDEPIVGGHERQTVDVVMYAGVGDFHADDAVHLDDGDPFEVIGKPANYDNNPWWSPGIEVVNLHRSEL